MPRRLLARPHLALLFALVTVSIVGCDQATKWQALAHLTDTFTRDAPSAPLGLGAKLSRFLFAAHPRRVARIAVLDDFWHFQYVENPGAAWSFLHDAPPVAGRLFLLATALAGMVLLVLYARRTTADEGLVRLGLALVLGGALGNFLDRLRLGYVIDFIEWHWYERATWPLFNVADVAISTGVALLILTSFMGRRSPVPR
ncbi:MAG: signal peptidase II [Deltaproteobacteria bacterium]|nr:signal peptidase II [Deltaproteobacteria bacterium]